MLIMIIEERKKQNRNNKFKKPQNERKRKQKLTWKPTAIFRFCHFKSMAKRTNIHERIHVSCVLEDLLFSSIFTDYISILSK